MSWRIVMVEHGEYLRLKMDNLYIKKGKSEFTIPLSDISIVLVSNQDAIITTRLLDAFTQYNISLVTCDYKYQPNGIFTGLNTNSRATKIFKNQIEWTNDFKNEAWKKIIYYKIYNQKEVIKNVIGNNGIDRINLLEDYLNQIEPGDVTNREGHAAKVYFNTIFGNDFVRDDDVDIRNACLNYIYAIVRAYFARLIVAYGLSGMIGVHHKNEYNNFNLVDDLMEPFRPYCDFYIINNLKNYEAFDLDVRIKLVDVLNHKIKYNEQNVMMCVAIERYIVSFLRYCKTGDIDEFLPPIIEINE